MRKVVFLGNCQANRYKELYAEKVAPHRGDEVSFVASFAPLTADIRLQIADADILALQVYDADPSIGLHNVETNAEVIRFPNVTGMFLWPFGGDPHPLNKPETFLPAGPFDLNMGDRFLNRKLRGATLGPADIERIADEYVALDLAAVANAGRLYELIIDRQRQRDAKSGFACADLIERHLHDDALFYTPSTFALPLFRHVVSELYARLGASRGVVDGVLDPMIRAPFPACERPIHPSVARFFDLRYVRPDHRYVSWTGEYLTLREYVIRYLQYDWNEPLLRGCVQAEHTRRDADPRDIQTAIRLIEQGLEGSPGSGRAERALSHLLSFLGDHDRAFAAYRRGVMLEPDDPHAQGNFAHLLAERGQTAEAEQVLRTAIERWPQVAQLWVRLGGTLAHLGRLQDASDVMRQASARHPNDAAIGRFRDEIAGRQAHADTALRNAQPAVEPPHAILAPPPIPAAVTAVAATNRRSPGMLFSWLLKSPKVRDARQSKPQADMARTPETDGAGVTGQPVETGAWPQVSTPAGAEPPAAGRTVVDSLSPQPVIAAADTGAVAAGGLRRTNRISWMVSGRIIPAALGPNGGGTTCLTIGCPDDFHAVRLGFVNTNAQPWTVSKVIGCASSGFGDYVIPAGGAGWVPFTFAAGGQDRDELVTAPDAPTEIIVAGSRTNSDSDEARPLAWTWTDWAPIQSIEPDPRTNMRVLMLRALVPSDQTICFASGQLRALTGNTELNRGFDCFVGGIKFNFDRVSDPTSNAGDTTDIWRDNQLAGGSLIPMVQFLTKNAGIVGIDAIGSDQPAPFGAEDTATCLYRTTTELGRRLIGTIPFGMVNGGVGDSALPSFLPGLETLLHAVRPSFVVLPCSDTGSDDSETTGRLVKAVELCRADGALAFVLPATSGQSGQATETDALLQLKTAGAVVLASSPAFEDGAIPYDTVQASAASELISWLRETCE